MDNYSYYNHNPDALHLQDCVCRAISTASGLKYKTVNNLLEITAKALGCEKLCVCCYDNLLEDILQYPRYDCHFQQTVNELASTYPRLKLIIRVNGHLTCSIYGNILDIWNCSQELVDCFWVVD